MPARSISSLIVLTAAIAVIMGQCASSSAQERGRAKTDGGGRSESRSAVTATPPAKRGGSRDAGVRQSNYEAEPTDTAVEEVRADLEATSTDSSEEKISLTPRRDEAALPLARPGKKAAGRPSGGLSSLATTLGSLVLVLALFFAAAWVLRRGLPKGSSQLPAEVVEVLGRAAFPGRQQIHLIRCGNKLLLVWATANGVETLTEITDPVEVDRLTSACREAQPGSASATFRQVFQQIGKEPARGFLEPTSKRAAAARTSSPALEANDA